MRLIRTVGWNVEAFASGHEFLARSPFSGRGCIILDVTMPDMTGLELRDQLAARNSAIPIILLTGGNEPTLRARGPGDVTSDFVDFLNKPVDANVLFKAIEIALQRTI